MPLFDNNTALMLPRGDKSGTFEVDLGDIVGVEKRQKEVAYANKETAPELMHIFNLGYAQTMKIMAQISYEYNQAVKLMKTRKSRVILDVAPVILKEKGLLDKKSPSGNKDLREAVLDQDQEYLDKQDIVLMLEAAYEYFKGKAESFKMSYQATKKIYDINNNRLGNVNNLGNSVPDYLNTGDLDKSWKIGEPKYDE